jgi:membrane-bound lytic murein transglycosylase D
LRRAITPPGRGAYTIKVPVGKKELVAKNLPRVRATVATGYKTHVIKKGDTVSRICRKYNINKKTLLKANNLRSTMLKAGHRLRIPYKTTSYKLVAKSEMATSLAPAEMTPENLIVHKIRPGETISELSRLYNVPAYMIAAWNGLENLHQIRAGQQLDLYLQDLDDADRQRLAAVKKKSTPIVINRAEASEDTIKSNTQLTYYRVKGGDSLWTIAKRFQTTPEKIRRWNNIEGNKIFPGRRLLLKADTDIDA